ncbi:MAG: hypothetical protein J5507_03285 [Clostridia bacterium]|nr:hypothetical protein [Clostridia bacterium]
MKPLNETDKCRKELKSAADTATHFILLAQIQEQYNISTPKSNETILKELRNAKEIIVSHSTELIARIERAIASIQE